MVPLATELLRSSPLLPAEEGQRGLLDTTTHGRLDHHPGTGFSGASAIEQPPSASARLGLFIGRIYGPDVLIARTGPHG